MKLIDNASGNVSQGITLSSENKADRYKLSYNCSNIGSGKSFIRIYATVIEGYKTYFMPVQFNGEVSFELSIDTEATFLQFDIVGDATMTGITLETVVDATMQYVKENASYWDRIKEITSNTGKVRTDMLEGLINLTLNAFANESGTITQENGIMTFMNGQTVKDSTEAVQIVGGAIRIANSKLANGEWNWTTALSGAGINAATIIAETFAALNITGVTITAGTIVGGTISGVTIEGSTIYAGDKAGGNYTEITSNGIVNCYTNGLRTIGLVRRPNGIVDIGRDIDGKNYMRINSDQSITIDGTNVYDGMGIKTMNGSQLIFDAQGNRIIFNGDIFCTGRIIKEWNGGFKTGDYVEL